MSIEENPGFSEESLRRIAAQKIKYRTLLRFHAVTYILINILLFAINLITQMDVTSPNGNIYFWSLLPLFGWLIGLSIHAMFYLCYARGVYSMMKRLAYVHLIAYVTVMVLLFTIDFDIMNNFEIEEVNWAHYPAVSWGVPMLLHVIVTKIIFSGKMTEDGLIKTRKERAIEKEMNKMRKKFGIQQN